MKLLTRLRLGCSHRNEHKFRHNFQDCLNLLCSWSLEIQDTVHSLLHCHRFSQYRFNLINSVKSVSDNFELFSDNIKRDILFCGDPRFNSFMTGPLSYRNQSIDLQSKSMDWFLYDKGLLHERVKTNKNELILEATIIYQKYLKVRWILFWIRFLIFTENHLIISGHIFIVRLYFNFLVSPHHTEYCGRGSRLHVIFVLFYFLGKRIIIEKKAPKTASQMSFGCLWL